MRKLLIVSASSNVLKEPQEPVEAMKRFDGILMRIVRRYYGNKKVDILLLSPVQGLVWADEKIPYKQPLGGGWYKLPLSEEKIKTSRETNLATLRRVLDASDYDEIHVGVGKYMLSLIEGFEKLVKKKTKVTYASSAGLGAKLKSLNQWFESQNRHA